MMMNQKLEHMTVEHLIDAIFQNIQHSIDSLAGANGKTGVDDPETIKFHRGKIQAYTDVLDMVGTGFTLVVKQENEKGGDKKEW